MLLHTAQMLATVDENRHHCLLGITENALTDWRVSLTKTAKQIFIVFDETRHFKKTLFWALSSQLPN